MTHKEKMFLESKAWALEKLSLDKEYFKRLSGLHSPNILWIGSIESLVPVRELINAEPGEVLVYRNMGVQIRHDDLSMLATIQDAVEVAKVDFIIVCGYSHCSGVEDVILGSDDRPYIKRWLEELRALYERNQDIFENLDFEQRTRLLCEINIKEQILKLGQMDVIQHAWEKGKKPTLLGWYFDLNNGGLKEVFEMNSSHKLEQMASLV